MEKTYDPHQLEQKWYKTWEEANYFSPKHDQTLQQQPQPSQQNTDATNAATPTTVAPAVTATTAAAPPPYCIVIPPPNITGSLHMGHGFQLSIMDALIRYKRMQGYNTLWQTGSDHAGIATQIVVEQQLAQQGTTRHDLGRDAFVAKIWEWKQISGDTICQQQRRMGISVDWSRHRFTLDPGLAEAVQHVFISLYEEGLIYRGKRLVNWDPALNTAVSDLEVINEEQDGKLWYFKYPLLNKENIKSNKGGENESESDNESGHDHIIIATTRPETMLGDVAVAVHPDDARYQHLIGKHVQLPITNRAIPIIADATVDPSFGSGCVKITPAHDFNDYATGQRHKLPLINIFTPQAQLNDNAPTAYRGLDRFVARDKIVAELDALGLLLKIEPHRISIPKGERSGTIVEPYLTDQWFVKMQELAIPAIDAVKSGAIRFIPEHWNKVYFQWLENIQDWCISRQLWWGHRIPAWYDEKGNIYVGRSLEEIKQKYKLDAALSSHSITLTQDEDVLDTWFSSALWPFSSLGWPEKTEEYKTFYPTNVLVTGFDIIFFWVARMVMMGLKFTGQVPFHEIYITGLIRDNKGKKMSKSKGNIIDPVDLIDGIGADALVTKRTSNLMQQSLARSIEKTTRTEFPQGIQAFGSDALRFTFCALASTGRDINFDFGRLEGYRNFCTKLWNAARYVLMQFEFDVDTATKTTDAATVQPTSTNDNAKNFNTATTKYGAAELWIKAKLHQTIKEAATHFQEYRFDLLAQTIYEFIWHEFCDWYVEFSKATLAFTADTKDTNSNNCDDCNNCDNHDDYKNGTRLTLLTTLETVLRLIHPLMPFISEEIWQTIIPLVRKYKKESSAFNDATIMLQPYPVYDEQAIDEEILREVEWLKKIIVAIRNIRGEMNIAPKKLLCLQLSKGTSLDKKYLEKNRNYLISLGRLEKITWSDEEKIESANATIVVAATTITNAGTAPVNKAFGATAIIDNLELHIPMENIIDKQAEISRLNKEISKLKIDHEKLAQKLNNQDYLNKAPAPIVAKEQQRLLETQNTLAQLKKTLAAILGI